MEPVPLCNKPNCLHQQEQDPEKVADCSAFFRDSRAEPLLAYYDGAVYLTALKDPFDSSGAIGLIRVKTDGTERETVLELPENSGVCLIHRGYLYYTVDTYNIELDADYGVYRQSLQGGKPELIYKGQWSRAVSDLWQHTAAISISRNPFPTLTSSASYLRCWYRICAQGKPARRLPTRKWPTP